MTQPIPNSIAAMTEELTAWRRDFHAHPELGYEERRTAGIVAEKLRDWGFDEVEEGVGVTGVVGVLHGAGGPAEDAEDRILVRADMDALPMTELSGLPHASTHEGRMHACGHDGHTTMLLGAAKHLAATRNFTGTVVFCFQPAEEGGAGAAAMLRDGLLTRRPVRAAYGVHNTPDLPVGHFAVASGPVMAYADQFRITITGKGGHAARPHQAADPVVAGAALVGAFQSIISRRRDPVKPAVISTTVFQAGSASNVIPETALLRGTVRTYDDEVSALIIDEMDRQCRLIGEAYGVEVHPELGIDAYPVCVNDPEQALFAGDVLEALAGPDRLDRNRAPSMGGEDFAFIAREVPSAFIWVGNGDGPRLHHPKYDFNDAASPWGVAWWARLVETALPRDG